MGSEHNDEFYVNDHGKIRTRTNRSGGIQVFFFPFVFQLSSFSLVTLFLRFWGFCTIYLQGGISNGEIINMRVAFKPTATISVSWISITAPHTIALVGCCFLLSNLYGLNSIHSYVQIPTLVFQLIHCN